MRLSKTARDFLIGLRTGLQHIGANPVVLRNYQDLPEAIGNDVDIFVSQTSLNSAIEVLVREVEEREGAVTHIHQRGYFVAFWVNFKNDDVALHLDLYPGALTWHGLEYLSMGRFLESTRHYRDWRIPHPAHEAILLILTSLLWGGFFKKTYRSQIEGLLDDPEVKKEFRDCLSNAFGDSGSELAAAVLAGKPIERIESLLAVKLRAALRRRCLSRNPGRALAGMAGHWLWEFRCYFVSRPGIWVRVPHDNQGFDKELNRVLQYFGGVLDERATVSNKCVRMLNRIRALGKNHLVILEGSQWEVQGEPSALVDQLSFFDRVLDALARRASKLKTIVD
jgi:hypothetical protein